MTNTLEYIVETTKITIKSSCGQVITKSSIHYIKRVMTIGFPEKSAESLAVELLRKGEMCSL